MKDEAQAEDEELYYYELPRFDIDCWSAETRHGLVWQIFTDNDPRNSDEGGYEEALKAVKTIIKTGQPLFGGWR